MRFPVILRFWPHLSPRKSSALFSAYRAVFGTEQGAAVLHDILREAGLVDVTGPDGPIAYNEGKRAVAKHILNILRYPEEETAKLLRTAANLQAEYNQAQMEANHDRPGY